MYVVAEDIEPTQDQERWRHIQGVINRPASPPVESYRDSIQSLGGCRPQIDGLVATCDDTLEGLRDRALLYFAFASGGRRRSEVAGADLADLHKQDALTYVYHLHHSKTQQAGPTATSTPDKPVLGVAAEAMSAWLAASGLTEGPIFRRLWKARIGAGLSDKAVALIIQRRAKRAGLKGDFGGHSPRSGFLTEGGRQGVALAALMQLTGHQSVAAAIGYFQSGDIAHNPAARLLDES